MKKINTKILITSPVLSRTYTRDEFLGKSRDHEIIYAEELRLPLFYRTYASIVFKILSIKYAYKSKTFRYRLVRATGLFDILLQLSYGRINIKFFFIFLLKVLINLLLIPFACLPRSMISRLNSAIPIGDKNSQFFDDCEVLVFPFTAFEVEQLFLPALCAKKKIKLVYIADNWDNLSSKTVILDPPDKMFVWGEQSVEHAKKIQGFSDDIIEIGSSPRLQVYSNMEKSQNKSKVLGFMGAFMYFDELATINKICDYLPPDWSIIYRPHPWAMSKQDFDCVQLHSKVSIDLDENGKIDNSIDGTKYFFEKVDMTTGGLTTMMLESLLAGRPCIALTISDNFLNFYSPRNAFKHYVHFNDVKKLSHFVAVDELYSFPEAFQFLDKKISSGMDRHWLDFHVNVNKPATLQRVLQSVK